MGNLCNLHKFPMEGKYEQKWELGMSELLVNEAKRREYVNTT